MYYKLKTETDLFVIYMQSWQPCDTVEHGAV